MNLVIYVILGVHLRKIEIIGTDTWHSIQLCSKIQSVFKLSDGSGLAVTVARYETPAHTDIDKVLLLF